jgi:hypothetical protein
VYSTRGRGGYHLIDFCIVSRFLKVANGKKINSLVGNILTKILHFALNKLSTEKMLCITRLDNVLQVFALVEPRLTPLSHHPCLHLGNGIF